ncbi:E3 ubiquitin-protein ligase RGLG2 [Prunus yedoensis var. nudiflora]|uniref:E3 ubiquitin-protein ligase RGLG2 n=1 Tax=Prunus yedoensis var. nudiflora TaxID=2094558 RepID=A0A314YCT0_PRUYE|nr:E3 ubiquitin-protein ligase RGLG2 [Prunus yedoensis var. nudiflora]
MGIHSHHALHKTPTTVTVPNPRRRLDRKYSKIADNYRSLDEVTSALAQAGLESSNLIVGIDFTKSNEWTGSRSFNRKSLHHIGNVQNPYEQAISIIGKTLSVFDEDNLIPCFGFGDASTHDQDVFSFYQDEQYCNGFEEVLARYREIVPHLRLAGPTSFAPIIEMARLLLSKAEASTIGDWRWPLGHDEGIDDNIPARAFDNFQFVNFTEIMSKKVDLSRKQTEFALSALMEIPSQYKATLELGILGTRNGNYPNRVPLPPPHYASVSSGSSNTKLYSNSNSFQQRTAPYAGYDNAGASIPSYSGYDSQVCPICLTNPKDMAFGCGHQEQTVLVDVILGPWQDGIGG